MGKMNPFNDYKIEEVQPFEGERILVVDDNPMNVEVLQYMLEVKNLTVETAADGEEALEKYKSNVEFYYDAIFLDINMSGMNGYDTCKAIRMSGRADSFYIPVYAVSAGMVDVKSGQGRACGMNGHIEKPYIFDDIYKRLHELFQKRKEMNQ